MTAAMTAYRYGGVLYIRAIYQASMHFENRDISLVHHSYRVRTVVHFEAGGGTLAPGHVKEKAAIIRQPLSELAMKGLLLYPRRCGNRLTISSSTVPRRSDGAIISEHNPSDGDRYAHSGNLNLLNGRAYVCAPLRPWGKKSTRVGRIRTCVASPTNLPLRNRSQGQRCSRWTCPGLGKTTFA